MKKKFSRESDIYTWIHKIFYIYVTIYLRCKTSIETSVLSVSSYIFLHILLNTTIISQFGDRQFDSMQYVHKEYIIYDSLYTKISSYKRLGRQFSITLLIIALIFPQYSIVHRVHSFTELSRENHFKSLTVENAGRVVHLMYNLHPRLQSRRAYQGEVSETSFGHYHKFTETVSRVTCHQYSHTYVALLQILRYVNFITLQQALYFVIELKHTLNL